MKLFVATAYADVEVIGHYKIKPTVTSNNDDIT